MLAIVAACATAPRIASPTPTHSPAPIATTTPVPTTGMTSSTGCKPAQGVQQVSPAVIRYGNTSKMLVSLTFDSDGGSAGTAMQYLNILRDRHTHATFFLTGLFARAHPDVVRRILAEDHELGDHTMDHPNLARPRRSDTFVCTELVQAERLIVAAGGRTSRPFFRPPYGSYNDQVRFLAARLGYRTVYWSIDPRDWDPRSTARVIVSRVLYSPGLKPGAIILMHINSPNEQYALTSIITGLEQRGYAIVPLSQLLQSVSSKGLRPPTTYAASTSRA
ncbi:MAG: polysaccharide deacetylase family protein [Ktedonobacterales bacterium]